MRLEFVETVRCRCLQQPAGQRVRGANHANSYRLRDRLPPRTFLFASRRVARLATRPAAVREAAVVTHGIHTANRQGVGGTLAAQASATMRRLRLPLYVALAVAAIGASVAGAAERAARPKVVVITGRAGAGKGTVATALAKKHGVTKWASGDVFRAEARRELQLKGITREPLPAEVSHEAALALADGDEAFGQKMGASILAAGVGKVVVVEGFRSPEAVAGFKKVFPDAQVVAIQVSAKRRHEAVLKVRSRSAANGTGEGARAGEDAAALRARDRGDAKLGVGRLIAQKDVVRIRPRNVDPDDYKTMDEVKAAIDVVTAESVAKIESLLGI